MLVSTDCCFDEAASAVTGCPLPTDAALLRDKLKVLVALALRVNRVRTQHRRCTRRDHHVWRRIMLFTRHRLVDRLAVVCTVRDEAGDLAFNLLEQTWNFANVVRTVVGQNVGDDLTGLCVDREVPCPNNFRPVLSTIRCLAPCEGTFGRRPAKSPLRRLSVV